VVIALTVGCLLVSAVLLNADGRRGKATPRKVAGTWMSIVEVPDNPITGPLVLEELDTFSADGTIITSSSAPFLELQPGLLVVSSAAHGIWKSTGGGNYMSHQLRFLTDTTTGMPMGYVRSVVRFRFLSRNEMTGTFTIQLLDPDKNVQLEVSGGTAHFFRLGAP
jgi:hypothetical protein